MSKWDKRTRRLAAVIFISLLSLGLALISRASSSSITFLSHDVEWLLFLSIAILVPLFKIQIFNEAFLKADIDQIQADITDLKHTSTAGVVKFVGKANEAATQLLNKLQDASEVYNTYIIYDNPYTSNTHASITKSFIDYLKEEKGLWEETVSQGGLSRIEEIRKQLGKLPQTLKVRVIKQDKGMFSVCNFIILRYPRAVERSDEIFFGWGYFKGGANENVFWSDDQNIISFFSGYHRVLRDDDISEAYVPIDS